MKLVYPKFWQALAWLQLLIVAVVTLMPEPPDLDAMPVLSWDKAQHFVAYAILMWSFLQAWEGRYVGRWVTLLVVFGVVLEFIQGIMGVRVMETFDMLANSLGVLLGYLAWLTPLGHGFRYVEGGIVGR
jgi:VanZ family protein